MYIVDIKMLLNYGYNAVRINKISPFSIRPKMSVMDTVVCLIYQYETLITGHYK